MFHIPNDDHTMDIMNKTYFFLIFKMAETEPDNVIIRWEFCTNQSNQITHTTVIPMFEEILIQELINAIFTQTQRKITIITYQEESIPILRQRMLFHNIDNIPLQDIVFLSLEKLLRDYFLLGDDHQKSIADLYDRLGLVYDDETLECQNLKRLFYRILPLLPDEVIQ